MKDSPDDFDFFEFVYYLRDKHCTKCIQDNNDCKGFRCQGCMYGVYLMEYYMFIGYDRTTAIQKMKEVTHNDRQRVYSV